MLKNSFFKTIPFLLFIVLFNSCDQEFNVVGEDLIGDNHFDLVKTQYPIIAYNQKIDAVQSNNLEINALGIYDNPSFGTTTANFNTQVALAVPNPTFDASAVITSVVLNVPYFATKTATDATTGANTYELDSIYGPKNPIEGKFKLSVYESGYYMRDLDPADQFLKPQKYYTDQNAEFNDLKIPTLLNSSEKTSQNSQFFFSPAELSVSSTDATGVVTTAKAPPGMQLDLDIPFFTEKLITKAPAGVLKTNDLFKDYFRGLYFQVESLGSPANQAMIDFKKGTITVVYKETVDSKTVNKTMKINLSGNTVSLLQESNNNTNYTNATDPAIINQNIGDDNLYLKGGQGSTSILKLFGGDNFGPDGITGEPNGVPDELDILRKNENLINDANIVFYLNSNAMGESAIPQRLYLYDFKNNQPLEKYSLLNGKLNKSTTGSYYYKFSVTDYVKSLVNKDSTNFQLGVVVAEAVNRQNMYALKVSTPIQKYVPMTSVMNPLGAILFGGTPAVPEDKRLKLEIYYTKPN